MKDKELRKVLINTGLIKELHDGSLSDREELRYLRHRVSELKDDISMLHKQIRMLYKHLELTEGLVKADTNKAPFTHCS